MSGKSTKKTFSICFGMLLAGSLFSGCEQKEKVLEIETRGGSLEIERSRESGDIDIKIDGKD